MNVKKFCLGFETPTHYAIYFGSLLTLTMTLLVISMIMNPIPFNMKDVCVSNLGNPTLNPEGYYFFTISLIMMGSFFFPIHFYMYRNFFSVQRKINMIWIFLMILFSIGLIGVGLFDETKGPIHYVFAVFSFGGLGLVMFFSLCIWGRNVCIIKEFPHWGKYLSLLIVCFLWSALAINELLHYGIAVPTDLFLAEWYAFFLLFSWLIGTFLILSEKKEPPT